MSSAPAKKQKKWKDPDKPKRPYSAYNFFAKEMYKPINAKLRKGIKDPSEINATNVMSEIAAQWRTLTAAKKVKYDKQAVSAKAKHVIAMGVYNAKKKAGKTAKKPKRAKDKTKPKRAMSAYLFFGKDCRPAVKKDLTVNGTAPSVTAVMTEVAARWQKCTGSKRNKFQAKADAAKEQYLKDVETWNKKQNEKAL